MNRGSWCWISSWVAATSVGCEPTGPDVPDEPPEQTPSVDPISDIEVSGALLYPTFDVAQHHYSILASSLQEPTTVSVEGGEDVTISLRTIDGVALETGASPFEGAIAVDQQIVVDAGVDREPYTITVLPDDLPDLDVGGSLEGAADGYYLVANWDLAPQPEGVGRYLLALDNRGVVVWYRATGEWPGWDLRAHVDGALAYVGWSDEDQDIRGIRLDAAYQPIGTYAPQPLANGTPTAIDVHEFAMTSDGTLIMVAVTPRWVDMAPYGAAEGCCTIYDNVIQELTLDGDVVFEWNSGDHLDFEGLPHAAFVGIADGWEYAHVNSVEVDPLDGNWIVSVRHSSEVLKIARNATTFGGVAHDAGEILWRLGGLRSDFTFVDDARGKNWSGFSYQHSARVVPGGLIVFDNAWWPDLQSTGDARYVDYALDTEAMTATVRESYAVEGAGYSAAAGSVQRLDNGNTLIGWGALNKTAREAPVMTEVNPDGEVVFELSMQPDQWTYRAFKHVQQSDGSWK